MPDADGLVCAYLLDGAGGGRPLDWAGVGEALERRAPLWVHLNRHAEETHRWIAERSGLDELARQAVLAEESRPRCDAMGDGLIVNLRGLNLNPGADPVDMVAVRLWIDQHKIISVRGRRLMAVEQIRATIEAGMGPETVADVLISLADRLVERMGSLLGELDDQLDALEEAIIEDVSRELRTKLSAVRRDAIALRRYIAPQRDAMSRLIAQPVPWLDQVDRELLREVADRTTRYVEDLEAARERSGVIQDELTNRLAERMEGTMYKLSVIAAIFLPLGLVTGILGVNLGGIPGQETPWAFALFLVLMVLLAAAMAWLFKWLRWL